MGVPRVSEAIGQQLARARKRRDWTQERLAQAVREHDEHSTLNRAAIGKIESGVRGVSIDEALLLAAAVNIPPPLLFLPIGAEDAVEITPRSRIHPYLAFKWLSGETPLASSARREIRGDEWLEGSGPLIWYHQFRTRQDDLHTAKQELSLAERAEDPERIKEARQVRDLALGRLHYHLGRMQAAGIGPPGQTPARLAEMEALGLDVSDFPVWEPPEAEGE